MRIAICGSLAFAYEMKELAEKLVGLGFEVHSPVTAMKIIDGEITLDEIMREKESGKFSQRSIQSDAIRRYHRIIKDADCALVANFEKNGIKGYIGGNAFLEMGFAHVLEKPIYLLHQVPDMPYKDEIIAMKPIVIEGDLTRIKQVVESNTSA